MMEENCTFSDINKKCNCILHCKDTNKSIQAFNKFIEKIIEENKESLVLSDITFPNNFEYNRIFNTCTKIQFIGCEFNKKMAHINIKDIFYTDCHFKESIWFFDEDDMCKTDIIYNLWFDYCIFEEEFNCDFSAGNMPRCNIDTLNIQNSTFKKSIKLNKCNINSYNNFSNNTVFGTSDFEDNSFIQTDFVRNKFNDVVSFKKSNFNQFSIEENTFDKLIIFQDTTFKSKLNLKSNIFKDEVNFLGIKNKDNKELEAENIANRETARIIKHSFEKLDNIIEANKFYALEMQKREKELLKEKNWLDLIVFKFHKISSNHSQDWSLVLFWIFMVGFIASLIEFYSIKTHLVKDTITEPVVTVFIISIIFITVMKYCISQVDKLIYFLFVFSIYVLITKDYTLSFFSKVINPFSIMKSEENINILQLVFKIILGYLYYQFIVSIRQNTRRK